MTVVSKDSKCAQTVPFSAPMPHRKVIRQWLAPIAKRDTSIAIGLFLVDWILFGLLVCGIILLDAWWAKAACSLCTGIMIGRLFIIGHDACHHSYTAHPWLNRILGRLAMLPSLTPYSLWQVGHNVVHHGYTNLKGIDFVWAPLTREEFENLPRWRRLLERVYRSSWGSALYYFNEMWWLRMFFPSREHMATQRMAFHVDSLIAALTAALWIGGLIFAAQTTGEPAWLLVLLGFMLPFLIWNALIGFVVYIHHTHPDVHWYTDKRTWAKSAPFVSTTVHLIFPMGLGNLFHNIMEHTAHHVDMGIPLYRLKQAQKILENRLAEKITVQRFSWRWYFQTTKRCKLYDFERQCWTDFQGQPTSPA